MVCLHNNGTAHDGRPLRGEPEVRLTSMRGVILGASLLLALSSPVRAEHLDPRQSPHPDSARSGSRRGFWSALGSRTTRLEDSRRAGENGYGNGNLEGNFLGSLWGLDAQQHYFPNPYLEYRVVSGVGIGATYDQLGPRRWTGPTTPRPPRLEMAISRFALAPTLVGRYRNRTRFEPYGTLGFAWYQSHFDVSPGWAAPGRRFEVEDTDGWFICPAAR